MSVLTDVERKTIKGRLFLVIITLATVVGGATMVYPFLLMVSGALRSPMDATEMDLLPDYLVDDTMLARKFLEYKYNYSPTLMNEYRGYQDYSFRQATIPETVNEQRVQDFAAFADVAQWPDHWWVLGGTELYRRTTGPNKNRFVARVRELYNDDRYALGDDMGIAVTTWRNLDILMPRWASRRYDRSDTRYFGAYLELAQQRPIAEGAPVSLTGPFLSGVIFPEYGRSSVEAFNAAHAQDIGSFMELTLSRTCPPADRPQMRAEWLAYVHELLNVSFVRSTVDDELWVAFLRERYGSVEDLNRVWQSSYASFSAITLPGDLQWVPVQRREDYRIFLEQLPPETLYLVGPEYEWRDWLERRYGTLDALNAAHSTSHADWSQIRIPLAEVELHHVLQHQAALRWQFAASNFLDVFDEVLLQGRSFINTIVFVGLSLLLTLTLQPLAAYALSRFNPPGTWRIILIFMATMAFPPMVGMIPQFLILRNFYLLNTFVALVLPVIVNGYLVFLLKGFFDSLPHHLYEAALIDGASELRMFWEITMALSKPILAVVALQTFNHAWIAFMYPLLVCPDESMHVLAVWLYQFQQQAPTTAVFAAILVTSIPTLVLFIFTQRTIMRGIAVPAEK